jgi:hypothetical protein
MAERHGWPAVLAGGWRSRPGVVRVAAALLVLFGLLLVLVEAGEGQLEVVVVATGLVLLVAAVAAVIDGGYLENSGTAALLELWELLEPLVANHNRAVAAGSNLPYVVPLFALADNHYSSVAASVPPGRVREVTAPLVGRSAPQTVVQSSVLEQAALLRFAGPPPGLPQARPRMTQSRCIEVRSFRVAPRKRPGVQAPLGWVLSHFSKDDLDRQLKDLKTSPATPTPTLGEASPHRPSDLSVLMALLQQQLWVTPIRDCPQAARSAKAS